MTICLNDFVSQKVIDAELYFSDKFNDIIDS